MPFPIPTRSAISSMQAAAGDRQPICPARCALRLSGMGIAMPYYLWDWGDEMALWRGRDLGGRTGAAAGTCRSGWRNDATCACGAEMIFRHRRSAAGFPVFLHRAFRRRRRGAGRAVCGWGPVAQCRGAGLAIRCRAGGRCWIWPRFRCFETMLGRVAAAARSRLGIAARRCPAGVAGQIRRRAVPCGAGERWRFWTCRWW